MPSTPTYRPCYTGNSVPLILCYLVFQNLLIITTVETYTHCYRFRWSGEGSRDAIVVSSVPMSETRSYFEIGESVSPYVSIYFSYIILHAFCCIKRSLLLLLFGSNQQQHIVLFYCQINAPWYYCPSIKHTHVLHCKSDMQFYV